MIIREFKCLDCGQSFESFSPDPECPTCTGESEREFLTAPAIKSEKTSASDKIVDSLAKDFGISDMTNQHGAAVKKANVDPKVAPQFVGPQIVQQMKIPTDARNSFAPFSGKLLHPNQSLRTRAS